MTLFVSLFSLREIQILTSSFDWMILIRFVRFTHLVTKQFSPCILSYILPAEGLLDEWMVWLAVFVIPVDLGISYRLEVIETFIHRR